MSGGFDLSQYLATEVARVDEALDRALATPDLGAVPAASVAAVEHGVRSGGKRLRPILCVAAWRETSMHPLPEADPRPYDMAVSLELIHAYSLIHDDLPCMDDADLRRGRPTTHRVHGEDAAITGGVALIPLAALQALRGASALGCDPDRSRSVARALLEAAGAGGMVGGQGLDLLGEERALDAANLDQLHAHKTGALLTAALIMGSRAAGAPRAVEGALEQYGRHIGLAFQIADDVLDATASTATLGKAPSDAELGKSTYVSLHGVRSARARARSEVESALAALDTQGLESPPLRALARYVVERNR